MARRFVPALLILSAGLFSLPTMAAGQLGLWVGVAHAEALEGQWGGDVMVAYNLVALPLEVFGGADYFVARCNRDCSLWGWRVGGNLRMGSPGIAPYVSGAWVRREWELEVAKSRKEGIALGGGLSIEAGFRIRGEVHREFLGGDLDRFVFRVSLGF